MTNKKIKRLLDKERNLQNTEVRHAVGGRKLRDELKSKGKPVGTIAGRAIVED
jgi:hypothetical protein